MISLDWAKWKLVTIAPAPLEQTVDVTGYSEWFIAGMRTQTNNQLSAAAAGIAMNVQRGRGSSSLNDVYFSASTDTGEIAVGAIGFCQFGIGTGRFTTADEDLFVDLPEYPITGEARVEIFQLGGDGNTTQEILSLSLIVPR